MLRSSEARETIEALEKKLVVKENIPAEEYYIRLHNKSLKEAYEKELLKAIAREVE